MVDLTRKNAEMFSAPPKDFYSIRRHCFHIVPKFGFSYGDLDTKAIIDALIATVPKGRIEGVCEISHIDNSVIVFEFLMPTRMKCNVIDRGNCVITRIKNIEIFKCLDKFKNY